MFDFQSPLYDMAQFPLKIRGKHIAWYVKYIKPQSRNEMNVTQHTNLKHGEINKC